jgi:hypothetical protein
VAHWVNEFFGLKDEERINKIKVHKLARWVIDQYEVEGRLTTISDQPPRQRASSTGPNTRPAQYGGVCAAPTSILSSRRIPNGGFLAAQILTPRLRSG